MFGHLKKRPQIPFQPPQEETIPLDAVCGSGSSSGSIPTDQYGIDQPTPQVDPIQVGPTG